MTETKTFFITGFPGFIAGRLVRELAKGGARFHLLVQPSFFERAQLELMTIAEETGRPLADFRLMEGDIAVPGLGLSDRDSDIARSEATSLFHLAAIYDLAVQRDLALRVNVGGTQNVNEFARSMNRLEHYHYVSTCYVAGKRTGVILETELEHDAGFRNHYEET